MRSGQLGNFVSILAGREGASVFLVQVMLVVDLQHTWTVHSSISQFKDISTFISHAAARLGGMLSVRCKKVLLSF